MPREAQRIRSRVPLSHFFFDGRNEEFPASDGVLVCDAGLRKK